MEYARICFSESPYSNTSSTTIFDAKNFSPLSLAKISHSICSFIIIAANVGAGFSSTIGITFHYRFLPGANNSSLSWASSSATTFQYPLSIYTAKNFSFVLGRVLKLLQRVMGKANGRVT